MYLNLFVYHKHEDVVIFDQWNYLVALSLAVNPKRSKTLSNIISIFHMKNNGCTVEKKNEKKKKHLFVSVQYTEKFPQPWEAKSGE